MRTIGRLQVGWSLPRMAQPGPTEGAPDALLGDGQHPRAGPASPGRTGFARVIRRGALPLAAVALLDGLWPVVVDAWPGVHRQPSRPCLRQREGFSGDSSVEVRAAISACEAV